VQQSPDRLARNEKVPRSPVCGRPSVASLQWYVSLCDQAQGGYWLLWYRGVGGAMQKARAHRPGPK